MKRPERLHGKRAVAAWRTRLPGGAALGFVPTMGALHEGHLSLVRAAREENDVVLASVFINFIQFGAGEDLDAYPRDLEGDLDKLGEAGADALVTFRDGEMYPPGYATYVDVERLTAGLCGASRPGHFRGVTTVVAKLFNLVRPHRAYFGQKDAQQAVVIRRMTEDLDFGIRIRVMPIVREADGLAMSSRNAYLSAEERKRALGLSRGLFRARDLVAGGERDAGAVVEAVREIIETVAGKEARVDYIAVVDPETLQPVDRIETRALAAAAVKVGPARLIDNVWLEPPDHAEKTGGSA